jgi:hypothetical protein
MTGTSAETGAKVGLLAKADMRCSSLTHMRPALPAFAELPGMDHLVLKGDRLTKATIYFDVCDLSNQVRHMATTIAEVTVTMGWARWHSRKFPRKASCTSDSDGSLAIAARSAEVKMERAIIHLMCLFIGSQLVTPRILQVAADSPRRWLAPVRAFVRPDIARVRCRSP